MHPILTWTLRVLSAARLAMLFLFAIYFVSVQVNAVAYLVGRNRPIIGGTTPPTPVDSTGSAIADIIGGLLVEALAGLVLFIAIVRIRAVIRQRLRWLVHRRYELALRKPDQ